MRNTLACREACSEVSLTPQGTGVAGGGADGRGVVTQEGVWAGGDGADERKEEAEGRSSGCRDANSILHCSREDLMGPRPGSAFLFGLFPFCSTSVVNFGERTFV